MLTDNDFSVWRWNPRRVCQFECWVLSLISSDLQILQSVLGSFLTVGCFKSKLTCQTLKLMFVTCCQYLQKFRQEIDFPSNKSKNKQTHAAMVWQYFRGRHHNAPTDWARSFFFFGLSKLRQFVQWQSHSPSINDEQNVILDAVSVLS